MFTLWIDSPFDYLWSIPACKSTGYILLVQINYCLTNEQGHVSSILCTISLSVKKKAWQSLIWRTNYGKTACSLLLGTHVGRESWLELRIKMSGRRGGDAAGRVQWGSRRRRWGGAAASTPSASLSSCPATRFAWFRPYVRSRALPRGANPRLVPSTLAPTYSKI